MLKRYIKIKYLISLPLILLAVMVPTAFAQSSSTNYKVEESYFGNGGELDASSPNYKAQQGVGNLTNGDTSSANYRAGAGFLTSQEPFVEMMVSSATINIGTLSSGSTSYGSAQAGTCNCSFTVRTYLSGSYIVQSVSNPPTNESGHILTAKSSQGSPSIGTEEFGMNLVANTSPATFGVNPVNRPDSTFADGTAATGYQTANQYKYNVGDTIARSAKTAGNQAIGQTDYTISYIANIAPLTYAGSYSMNQYLVVVGSY